MSWFSHPSGWGEGQTKSDGVDGGGSINNEERLRLTLTEGRSRQPRKDLVDSIWRDLSIEMDG